MVYHFLNWISCHSFLLRGWSRWCFHTPTQPFIMHDLLSGIPWPMNHLQDIHPHLLCYKTCQRGNRVRWGLWWVLVSWTCFVVFAELLSFWVLYLMNEGWRNTPRSWVCDGGWAMAGEYAWTHHPCLWSSETPSGLLLLLIPFSFLLNWHQNNSLNRQQNNYFIFILTCFLQPHLAQHS